MRDGVERGRSWEGLSLSNSIVGELEYLVLGVGPGGGELDATHHGFA